jgi:hypothetical protein
MPPSGAAGKDAEGGVDDDAMLFFSDIMEAAMF